jgi:hypothetical protein
MLLEVWSAGYIAFRPIEKNIRTWQRKSTHIMGVWERERERERKREGTRERGQGTAERNQVQKRYQ